MITKREWDIIARCVANHPAGMDNDEIDSLLKKLSNLTDCEREEVCILNT